jgi:uncharacterized protein
MRTVLLEEARCIALHSQGLTGRNFGRGKKGALNVLEHLGYVQIDTLAVVERAHHHTLWTRLADYDPGHLDELLSKDKKIFEYWSHAASYLPMSEYRYSLTRKQVYRNGQSHWFRKDDKVMRYVLDRIKNEGALMSKDFEVKGKRAGAWYEWKPTKKALEQLFMDGTLMVARRQGFQKVYDLAERVLPAGVDTSMPTGQEYINYLIRKAIGSHGIVNEQEIGYLRKGLGNQIQAGLSRMVKEGQIIAVNVESAKGTYYTTEAMLRLPAERSVAPAVHILSPFDNLLIQRKRIERIFNFNYMIECYVPEPRRVYGYFCLPVLFNDTFAGRFDPKADRAAKTFYVHKLFIEPGFRQMDEFLPAFAQKLKEFALFNACSKIMIGQTEPNGIAKELRKLVK